MDRPVRAGCSIITFVNFETPLLMLSIRRIPCPFEGVKKQCPDFASWTNLGRVAGTKGTGWVKNNRAIKIYETTLEFVKERLTAVVDS
jgi:hypothetical protein